MGDKAHRYGSVRLTCSLACVVAILLSIWVFPNLLPAQVGSAGMLGTVADPTGAVIVGAKVTVKNLGTSIERTTTTSSKGEYVVDLLPIGTYSLKVEAPGFKVYTVKGIALSTGDRDRVDAKLETGAVSENIEVTANTAVIMQSDSSTVSNTIETSSIQDLPLPNRNYFAVVETTAGINTGNPGGSSTSFASATSGNSNADRRPASTIVANGQSDALNNNMVNGFDNNELMNGIAGARPTTDGIAEVHVESTNAQAEYGRAAGAVVNVVTKSGTNAFHGSAFEYIKNEYFDARLWANLKPNHQALDRQNNYGGSIGGPVQIPKLYNGKDKTFFFFAFERDPSSKGQSFMTRVPTKYEVNHPGDFTDIGIETPSNFVALPVALAMFKLYPEPNAGETGTGQTRIGWYASAPSQTQKMMDLEGRVDEHFSASDTLFARYAYNPANTLTPGALPMNGNASLVGNAGVSSPGYSVTGTQNLQLDYAHIFKPNLLLDLKAGYSRYNSQAYGINYGKGLAAEFGVPNAMPTGTVGDDLPFFGGPDFVWDGIGGGATYRDVSNSYQYGGSLIYTRGSHDFKFGGGLIYRQLSFAGNASAAGRAITGVPLPPYFDQRLDFLGGYPILFFQNAPVYTTFFTNKEWSGYAQDNWRVTPKLTVNLGLRYDIFNTYNERYNHSSNFNAATLKDGLPLDAHNFNVGGTAGIDTDYENVVPRIGFAYSFDKKTVLRGGFGMSYSPAANSITSGGNAPFVFNYAAFQPDLNLSSTWKTPVASDINHWNDDSSITTLTAVPAKSPSIRVYQTNLSVQREFGANTVTAAYVGVFGRGLASELELNKPNMPGAGNPTAAYVYTKQSSGGPPHPAQSPYAVLNNVNSITTSIHNGLTNYHGLQLIYARHVGKDLTVNANWTWAHSFKTTDSMGQQARGFMSANNDELAYGNSLNDIRHRITATASYALPFGKNAKGWEAAIIKGWQANTVFQWQTGTPFSIISSIPCYYTQPQGPPGQPPPPPVTLDSRCGNADGYSYTNQQGQTYYLPNIVGKVLLNRNFDESSFNLTAFAPPEPGTNGNEGVNPFYGPHFRNDDVSLFKTFQFTERVGLQFRAECFNISNTPNFATPNANLASWVQGAATADNPSGLVAGGISYNKGTVSLSVQRNFQFALKLLF
jgi:outer membrane receptor protein involved in Fe transport